MSSTVPDVEQIEARERRILSQAPFEARHVPDAETQAYDAVMAEPFHPTSTVSAYGTVVVEAGTILELKTCQQWIGDRHSRSGRRRGQFKLQKGHHETLKELDAKYASLVLTEDERLLGGRLVDPSDLDPVLSWTNGGSKYADERATVPWYKIVPKAEVEIRGSA